MTAMALEGLRVVEFGDFISAPFCGKLLADFGADVIKVERPKVGDESRRYGPFPDDLPHVDRSGLFIYMNANKRSVTLDASTATGQDIFNALVADADILIENQQPGVMKSLGLTYDKLSKINPGLVMTSISVFGQTGPYSKYKGYDLTAWNASGVPHRYMGEPDRAPLRAAWYHADHWGAICAAVSTMIAAIARDVIGEGQHVDLSQADVLACHIMGYQLISVYHMTGEWDVRTGETRMTSYPTGIHPCADGHMALMLLEQSQWRGFVNAMGNPEWALNPIFDIPMWDLREYSEEIRVMAEPWFEERTKKELFEVLQANKVPSGPVNNAEDVANDPHLNARGFFAEYDQPEVGPVKVPGRPFVMSKTPWSLRRPAPTLGEHNVEILGGRYGFSGVDLTDLRRTGII